MAPTAEVNHLQSTKGSTIVTFASTASFESADTFPSQAWQSEKGDEKYSAALLKFKRQALKDAHLSPLLGCCRRNSVTGEILLTPKNDNIPDFVLVDVYRRPEISHDLDHLKSDPYLFKPVVLTYRTWIYHEGFRERTPAPGGKGHEMVAKAMAEPCIDIEDDAGRSSSLRIAPLLILTGLTRDESLAIAAALFVVCSCFISLLTNKVKRYRFCRMCSFPMRLAFLVYMFMRVKVDVLAFLGYLAWIVAFCGDVYYGDYMAFSKYGFTCTYKIIKVLPKRIFVCERAGAAQLLHGDRPEVQECVTGFSPWERSYILVADVGGVLVELRPMQEEDWYELANNARSVTTRSDSQPTRTNKLIPYIGLDMVGPYGNQGAEFMDEKEWRLLAEEEKKGAGRSPQATQLTLEDV